MTQTLFQANRQEFQNAYVNKDEKKKKKAKRNRKPASSSSVYNSMETDQQKSKWLPHSSVFILCRERLVLIYSFFCCFFFVDTYR